MNTKPGVLVTRRLPQAVEDRLARDYQPRLNSDDVVYTSDQLLELAAGAAAIIPCHTERLSAEVIERLPDSVRAICSFSVGYDHIDLDAAKARGISVTNTPEVLSNATAEVAMLLAVDVGNTHTVWGVFEKAGWPQRRTAGSCASGATAGSAPACTNSRLPFLWEGTQRSSRNVRWGPMACDSRAAISKRASAERVPSPACTP